MSSSCWWNAGLTSAQAEVISPLGLQAWRDLPSGQPVFMGPTSSPGKSGRLELAFSLGLPPASSLGSSVELL
ncbi:hypothetical protein L3X38_004851 [Prunus dulcis]|uniref:Uncharacterized protein n=1 Tax=Prunus dulcis TaxID=3755 RepID=A0AAD4ZPR7_PRUDU|nr:hypothetical protein L3X38_004851 [Prunus dulcis]